MGYTIQHLRIERKGYQPRRKVSLGLATLL